MSIRSIVKFTVAWLLLIASLAHADEVLVSFSNGEKITKTDLKNYVSRRADLVLTLRSLHGVKNALQEMSFTRVLVLEGLERSIPNKSKVPDDRFDDIYGVDVYKTITKPCIEPKNSTEKRQFFEEHPEVFRVPPTARLERFMLPIQESIEGLDAKSKMAEWRSQWLQNNTSLGEIGSSASKIFNLEVQGDIGWINLSDEVPLMRAVALARKGEMVGPVVDGDFVYLFFIADKHEGRQLTWEEIESDIAQSALSYCKKSTKNDLELRLFEKYGVKLSSQNIDKFFQ